MPHIVPAIGVRSSICPSQLSSMPLHFSSTALLGAAFAGHVFCALQQVFGVAWLLFGFAASQQTTVFVFVGSHLNTPFVAHAPCPAEHCLSRFENESSACPLQLPSKLSQI